MSDPIRTAIQQVLDAYQDGWSVAHFVVAIGLERIQDGEIETDAWMYIPNNQPDYVSDGLLRAVEEMRENIDNDTTD